MFELVLGMDFLMAAQVGILPYLGSLVFLEFGTPYVVKTVSMEEEPNFDLTRMVHTSDIVGVWPEGSKNQSADDHESQGSGQAVKTETGQGEDAKLESTRTLTSWGGGGFVTPLSRVTM